MSDSPEKPKFDKKSSQRNAPEVSPSEGDFWDLEDEGPDPGSVITPEPRQPGSKSATPAAPKNSPPAAEAKQKKSADSSSAETSGSEELGKVSKTGDDPALDEAQGQSKESLLSDERSTGSRSNRKNASQVPAGLSKAERISLISFGVVILLGIGWALSLFFSKIPTEAPEKPVKFPVAGKQVTINGITTYWRDPKSGSDRGIRNDIRLIPCAELKLGPSKSSGALRVLFSDDTGTIVGDPVTLRISNGSFDGGGDTLEVHATGGFEDEGDHAAYLTDQIKTWHLLIKEGPDVNAPGSAFTDLLRVPLSKSRR